MRTKFFTVVVLALFVPFTLFASVPGAELTYETVHLTANGDLIVVGNQLSYPNPDSLEPAIDAVVSRLSQQGDVVWKKTIDGGALGHCRLYNENKNSLHNRSALVLKSEEVVLALACEKHQDIVLAILDNYQGVKVKALDFGFEYALSADLAQISDQSVLLFGKATVDSSTVFKVDLSPDGLSKANQWDTSILGSSGNVLSINATSDERLELLMRPYGQDQLEFVQTHLGNLNEFKVVPFVQDISGYTNTNLVIEGLTTLYFPNSISEEKSASFHVKTADNNIKQINTNYITRGFDFYFGGLDTFTFGYFIADMWGHSLQKVVLLDSNGQVTDIFSPKVSDDLTLETLNIGRDGNLLVLGKRVVEGAKTYTRDSVFLILNRKGEVLKETTF